MAATLNTIRIVLLDKKTKEPLAVLSTMKAATKYLQTSEQYIRHLCNNNNEPMEGREHTFEDIFDLMWAEEWENIHGELLPGARVNLPI